MTTTARFPDATPYPVAHEGSDCGAIMAEPLPAHTSKGHTLSQNTSYNFEIAKVVAITLVAVGHFGIGYNLWVPVTVCLFVFGFSSGFFTAAKYEKRFDFVEFWRRKLCRLGPSLLVLNLFLLGLFILRGRTGLVTWQTPVNMLGLTGILNWFGLNDPSPFGAGLWFFTILLIFYLVYPCLRFVGRSRAALAILAGLSLAASVGLTYWVPMTHMLWVTAWSFMFGVTAHRFQLSLPTMVSGPLAVTLAVVLVMLNVRFGFNALNICLIVAISASAVLWVKGVSLPRKLLSPLRLFSGCVLEIYFLHAYLYVRPTGYMAFDLAASLVCILSIAWLLSRAADRIRAFPGFPRAAGSPTSVGSPSGSISRFRV